MPLSDPAVKKAKAADKPYKLADEKGLFLLVKPQEGKWWRLKYRFGGEGEATGAQGMNLPGWGLHPLKGRELKGYFSVWVSGNWRMTFTFEP